MITSIISSILISQQAKSAPEINLLDTQGKRWTIERLTKDKVYLIDFWATWCTTCRANEPILFEFIEKNRGDKLEVLAVSIDTDLKALTGYIKEKKPKFPVLIDSSGEMWKRWGVKNVPHYFMIRNGQIMWEHVGLIKPGQLEEGFKLASGVNLNSVSE